MAFRDRIIECEALRGKARGFIETKTSSNVSATVLRVSVCVCLKECVWVTCACHKPVAP